MIRELSELGKTLRADKSDTELIHDAIKKEPIAIEIVISNEGDFINFLSVDDKPTDAEAITAKKGKARLLLDKAEEVLCFGGEKSVKKHELFIEKLSKYRELPELMPVISFYQQNKIKGVETAVERFPLAFPDEKSRKGNIGFRIESEGTRVHEKPQVLKRIIESYESMQNNLLSSSQKNCSLCGRSEYPVEDIPHGMVKRVPNGQSSGCALVSYNENAFESYDLKGNNNSAICTNCAKTYVEGLNWLLSSGNEIPVEDKKGKAKKQFRYSNRRNFGSDTAMVFWTRNNAKVEEIDFLEEPKPSEVARLIDSVTSGAQGEARYLEADQFYSCTLSGSAARIAVRDWIETSLFDFKGAIAKWFQDIAISEYDWEAKETKIHYARLYDLARSCQRKNSDGKNDKDDTSLARVAANLWNAALKNSLPPLWILTKVIQRARLDGVTADRAALIKLILNRHNRGGDFMVTESIMEGSRPVAYVCGQIFAKMESIQYWAASGDRNAGIRERYFTYAMTLPKAAFGRLFDLSSKHYRKVKSENTGLAINLDKELQDLVKDIDPNELPSTFSLEEKGLFAIGYYHQRQKQFENSKSKTKKEGK